MVEPVEPVVPAPSPDTPRDEGGEAPCSAHQLEEHVTDVPLGDVGQDPADPA